MGLSFLLNGSFEIHIVGLNIDLNNPSLQALIDEQTKELFVLSKWQKIRKSGFVDVLAQAQALACMAINPCSFCSSNSKPRRN